MLLGQRSAPSGALSDSAIFAAFSAIFGTGFASHTRVYARSCCRNFGCFRRAENFLPFVAKVVKCPCRE
jgi:hypothetical protein